MVAVGGGWAVFFWATMEAGHHMARLDWSECPAVESVADRRSGAWVFRNTRMPVATVFENLDAGSSIEEIMEQFHVTRERIQAVLACVARSLDAPAVPVVAADLLMRIRLDHGIPSRIAKALVGHSTHLVEAGV